MTTPEKKTSGDSSHQKPEFTWTPIPSAQTIFRQHLLSPEAEELITQITRELSPQVWERDRDVVRRIEQAATAENLLDLIPRVRGLAEPVWQRRMRESGPEVVPLLAARLKAAGDIEDEDSRTTAYEHLISALRWHGEAGASILLDGFGDLDDYGKSLACIVLGQLGAQDSADVLWVFYQNVKDNPHENYFVGPLWGLVDLNDARSADALEELLWAEHYFYEIFALAHRAADARAVLPLLYAFHVGNDEMKELAFKALSGVAHRIGRDPLLNGIQHIGSEAGVTKSQHESLADRILGFPPSLAEEYFAVFYRGLRPDEIDQDKMKVQLDRFEWPGPAPLMHRRHKESRKTRPAEAKLGRNDPCWCGSGKKYKHCHWQGDREGNL